MPKLHIDDWDVVLARTVPIFIVPLPRVNNTVLCKVIKVVHKLLRVEALDKSPVLLPYPPNMLCVDLPAKALLKTPLIVILTLDNKAVTLVLEWPVAMLHKAIPLKLINTLLLPVARAVLNANAISIALPYEKIIRFPRYLLAFEGVAFDIPAPFVGVVVKAVPLLSLSRYILVLK